MFALPQSSAGCLGGCKGRPTIHRGRQAECGLMKVLLEIVVCEISFSEIFCRTPVALLSSSVMVPVLSEQSCIPFQVLQETYHKMRLMERRRFIRGDAHMREKWEKARLNEEVGKVGWWKYPGPL